MFADLSSPLSEINVIVTVKAKMRGLDCASSRAKKTFSCPRGLRARLHLTTELLTLQLTQHIEKWD